MYLGHRRGTLIRSEFVIHVCLDKTKYQQPILYVYLGKQRRMQAWESIKSLGEAFWTFSLLLGRQIPIIQGQIASLYDSFAKRWANAMIAAF